MTTTTTTNNEDINKNSNKRSSSKRSEGEGVAEMSPKNSLGGTQRASITMTRYTGKGQLGLRWKALKLATP
ncbi:hypothetical protein E2C01_093897 [Portunus trituberculatus]|uniref:Uncharacterized protein n=1 Tax=Portunus trituberculatus TaxID=210409 RepID=A0A5B7K1N3_PORTR|nr:hypothetical protein [Portunus trituberculatus]